MRINLLKNHRVLSEKEYAREKKIAQWSLLGLMVLVVITVAMAIWNFVLAQKLAGIEKSITKANTQMQGLTQANAEQVYVKNRLKLIGNFMDEQTIARDALQQVLALSLPGVTIGAITFTEENEISVVVAALDMTSLEESLKYYQKEDGFFTQVINGGISKSKDGSYEMKVRLSLPKAEK